MDSRRFELHASTRAELYALVDLFDRTPIRTAFDALGVSRLTHLPTDEQLPFLHRVLDHLVAQHG